MKGDDRTSPTSICVTWRRPNGETGWDEGKDFEDKRNLIAHVDSNHFP